MASSPRRVECPTAARGPARQSTAATAPQAEATQAREQQWQCRWQRHGRNVQLSAQTAVLGAGLQAGDLENELAAAIQLQGGQCRARDGIDAAGIDANRP